MSLVEQAFTELFYGAGSWLGLILLMSLCIIPTYKWREVGILFMPITVFLGVEYLGQNLEWQALIMFFTAIFIIFLFADGLKKGKD